MVMIGAVKFTLLAFSIAFSSGEGCRIVQFEPATEDKILRNHVILSFEEPNRDICQVHCYQDPNCMSLNHGPEGDGSQMCELNDRSHLQVPSGDLEVRSGYIYQSIVNFCLSNPCPSSATCQSGFTPKGYQCICPNGLRGDHCETDVDECSNGTHDCDSQATCSNTEGSFECSCHPGYTGDGISCTDIDECSVGSHGCSGNGRCLNSDGSYQCICSVGYLGDGFSCNLVPESSWVPGRNDFSNYLYISIDFKATWTDASESCTGLGAQLVKIESEDEVNFLETTFLGSSKWYWIGLAYDTQDAVWKWSDSTELGAFTKWAPNKPYLPEERYCALTKRGPVDSFSFAGHWNNVACHQLLRYICEKWNVV